MDAERIAWILEEHFPNPQVPLLHSDPYTLLIAVMLSAQCTDLRVNKVTPHLFKRADTPQKMTALSVAEIEEIIRPCGLFSTKAKNIWNGSKIICEEHGGKVPASFEELEALPGVGHKTASVVMSQAFLVPAFPVDTHIFRCARRWGLSCGKTVEHVEADLKRAFLQESWNKLHLQIIFFARRFCSARGHRLSLCPICSHLKEEICR